MSELWGPQWQQGPMPTRTDWVLVFIGIGIIVCLLGIAASIIIPIMLS